MGTVADATDARVGARRTKDAEQGDGDGERALGRSNLVEVAFLGGVGVDSVVYFAEDGLGVGDDDDADHGNQASNELLAGKRLTKKDMAGPGGGKGDQEAEDGGFSEGEVMHRIIQREEADETEQAAEDKPSSHLGRAQGEMRHLDIPHVQEAENRGHPHAEHNDLSSRRKGKSAVKVQGLVGSKHQPVAQGMHARLVAGSGPWHPLRSRRVRRSG